MKKKEEISIIWFRRDLRIDDNLSLYSALKLPHKIQPIFIFDTDILSRFLNPADARISFIADGLNEIQKYFRQKGSELLIFHGSPTEIVPKIAIELNATNIFAGQDFEPYGIKRDEIIASILKTHNINLNLQNDHLIIPPTEILKPDKSPYKVFSAYAKTWNATLKDNHIKIYSIENDEKRYNISNQTNLNNIINYSDIDSLLKQIGYKYSPNKNWPISNLNETFKSFYDTKINLYSTNRNYMAIDGTSRLSPYLRFGMISARKCLSKAISHKNAETWVNELIWRDFYAAILYYYPNTVNEEFLPQYRSLEWNNDEKLLSKWQQGLTGFPIIDAAMTQLNSEGWMHNRCRMIVASFLTKDLLIDWRLGEEYFAQHLMDYELSSNIGGWQWSASVGTDAQPYFRVFNPSRQSLSFDPSGDYIKKYLPVLNSVPSKYIHEPKKYSSFIKYPDPIVDHNESRLKALALFKNCSVVY